MLAGQVETLECLMARWYVGTLFGTLARKKEKLACFWNLDTQALWHVNQAGTQARWHVNHAGTQARWHVDDVGTQAHMARDLGNSVFVNDRIINSTRFFS